MAEILRMPRMSDTMTEGNIVEWHKKVGDEVEPGDVLAEVETDKATMELESYFEGTLLYIGVEEGTVDIDAILAVIGDEDEDWEAELEAARKEDKQSSDDAEEDSAEQDKKEDSAEKEEKESSSDKEESASSAQGDQGRIKASPLAKKMAEEQGIDLAKVKGSGTDGRIVKADIESYKPEAAPGPSVSAPKQAEAREEDEVVQVSQMRKTIARRLAESKFTAPHFYLTINIDMTEAMRVRKEINAMIAPDKISFNDLVVKAAAVALKKHPNVNASWTGDTIIKHSAVNVGVAVAIDDGLMVPVIKNANTKSLTEINGEVADKASRARERKLDMVEMQGNTFTISNLGMFGIDEFTAIINPPESCILAVGTISELPVVKDGEIVVGHQMKVTMSCDHRVVDGATGAQFLQTFQAMMENPVRMIV